MEKTMVVARCVNQNDRAVFHLMIKAFLTEIPCDYIIFKDHTRGNIEYSYSTFKYFNKTKYHTIPEFLSEIELGDIDTVMVVNLKNINVSDECLKTVYNVFRDRKVDYLQATKSLPIDNSIEIMSKKYLILKKNEGALSYKNTYLLPEKLGDDNLYLTGEREIEELYNNAEDKMRYPVKLYMQLVDRCCLQCKKCVYRPRRKDFSERTKKEFCFDLLKKLVNEVASYEVVPCLAPNFDNEPLLYKHFEDFLSLSTEKNVPVSMTTNAVALTPQKIESILNNYVINVVFSVDAIKQSTYSKLQPKALLSKVESHINRFLDRRGSRNTPYVAFCFTENHENRDEFQSFLEKWSGSADIIRNNTFKLDENMSFVTKPFNHSPHGHCLCVFEDLFITYDGFVYNCHRDVLVNKRLPSNLNDKSLLSIYNSKELALKREAQVNKKYPEYCQTCLESAIKSVHYESCDGITIKNYPYHKIYTVM